jgi:ABC-type glycerol-3-phosphate transport system permease component
MIRIAISQAGVRGDRADAAARQCEFREQDRRARRQIDLALTDQDIERLRTEHETRVWRASLWAYGLCLCAVIAPLLSMLLGRFRPQAEPFGQWFARSGAVMTVFAVYAQFKAASIATMIQGRRYGESRAFYRKYNSCQAIVAVLSLVLAVIGTIVWGYGDLLFPLPRTG